MGNDTDKVIFIHGLGQTPECWNKTVSALSKSMIPECISLFSIGSGGEITYQTLYHAFEKYCERKCGKLNLCGISLGAVIALNYAIRHPRKVKSLVLIAPQYKMPRLLLKLQNIFFLFIPKLYFRELGMSKKDVIGLTDSMLNLKLENGLNRITCTTLVVCGERDFANKRAAIRLADKIPTSSLRMIKSAGHEVNIEAPDRLAHILNHFYLDPDNTHKQKKNIAYISS